MAKAIWDEDVSTEEDNKGEAADGEAASAAGDGREDASGANADAAKEGI
jgi:hypothetical protein